MKMKIPLNKCQVCGFKWEGVEDCCKCAFNKKYGVWIDLRNKNHRIAFWREFGHIIEIKLRNSDIK